MIQIRNGAGRTIAEVGNEIAGGGGLFRSEQRELSWTSVAGQRKKRLPDAEGTEVFFRKSVLYGKRLWVADDAVRAKDRTSAGITPLLIWPHDSALSMEDGVVRMANEVGSVIAGVRDEFQFDAFNLTDAEAMEHGGPAEVTPACSGSTGRLGRSSLPSSSPELPPSA